MIYEDGILAQMLLDFSLQLCPQHLQKNCLRYASVAPCGDIMLMDAASALYLSMAEGFPHWVGGFGAGLFTWTVQIYVPNIAVVGRFFELTRSAP